MTNDVITVNRKYLPAVSFKFWGFTVQFLNSEPDVADTGLVLPPPLVPVLQQVLHRRGAQVIKDEHLKRDDVLEYMLKRV